MIQELRATDPPTAHDLHPHEVDLLLAMADLAEANDRPMARSALEKDLRLETAEFVAGCVT